MTAFTAQIATHAGTQLTYDNPEATDNTAPTGPGLGLLVVNVSGAPVNVTFDIPPTVHGLAVTPRVVAVADTKTKAIPLPADVYGDADGVATFDVSGTVASVNVACVSFGS